MKRAGYILGGLMLLSSLGTVAQELAPNQNPNYMRSAEKYAAQSETLTASQSTTVQDTYKAYDWREAKAEEKQEREDRRYELRKMRIETRNRCYPPRRNYGYYNGYNNGYYYNPGYNYNGYNYNNGYYGAPNCSSLLYGAGLGLGLYYLLN